MNTETTSLGIKIPANVIVKAARLLPMQYTLREISEELDIPESTLRGWFERGAPHTRDLHNHSNSSGRRALSPSPGQSRRSKPAPQTRSPQSRAGWGRSNLRAPRCLATPVIFSPSPG